MREIIEKACDAIYGACVKRVVVLEQGFWGRYSYDEYDDLLDKKADAAKEMQKILSALDSIIDVLANFSDESICATPIGWTGIGYAIHQMDDETIKKFVDTPVATYGLPHYSNQTVRDLFDFVLDWYCDDVPDEWYTEDGNFLYNPY